MKKNIHEEDFDLQDDSFFSQMDKAKLIVGVVPVVLIIIILAVTLIVNGNKKDKTQTEDLQQSIMDYADESRPAEGAAVKREEVTAEPSDEDKAPEASAVPEEVSEDNSLPKDDQTEAEASPTPYRQVMNTEKTDYSKVSYNRDEQLKEMMAYWADNNQKALDDLANLDRFKAMSWALKNTMDFYYYGDRNASGQPEGKGIAVYADNQYYYGDWKNGQRSGDGTWIHYHIHNTDSSTDPCLYHQYTGSWAEDLPDGEGSEHYDYEASLIKQNKIYNTNLIGSYSKGLVHGDFYLTTFYAENEYREWNAKGDHGSWIYQNENKDKVGRKPVYVSTLNPDDYIWMLPKENKNIGVPCLISAKK
ncbi:MAG: hypothetical protein NC429_09895 [Lachnospiraceae bacterium]|nr:hypothetical protein [Lachnospiraceae bacterium]